MPIPAALQSHLDDLSMFTDRAERIDFLIALAEQYKPKDSLVVPRVESRKVPGCESEVFMNVTPTGFLFAVDNPQGISAMALAHILESSLEGAAKSEIVEIPEEIVLEIFGGELSMGKNLGLTNMVKMVKAEAARG